MSDIDQWIAQAEARCEAATKEPWTHEGRWAEDYVASDDNGLIAVGPWGCGMDEADAAHIAHARTDLPRALRLIRHYRNALTRIRDHDCTHMHEGCTCGMLDLPAVAEEALAYTGDE